jgi:hypothetical protein
MRDLWADDSGFIVSLELLLIATLLVIGLAACWSGLRAAIAAEFLVIENAILDLHTQWDIRPVVVKIAPLDEPEIVSLLP